MNTLRYCPADTINLFKKLFAYTIKDSFYRKFSFKCPPHLSRVRNLTFLPHLLNQNAHWKDITIDSIAQEFLLQTNDLDGILQNPSLLYQGADATAIGDSFLEYRLTHSLNVPSRLRQLYSWNLNSWKSITQPEYKLRRVRKLLRQGPVCLQETKWNGTQEESILQNIPGVQISSSNATPNENGELTGGVAILLPAGWVVQQEVNLVKGRAIATLVKDRTLQFYILSIYLRPCERKQNLEEILQSWRNTVKQSNHVFIAGDFNNVDQQFPELWNRFLLAFGCHDVYPTLPTYFYQGGESALDRCLIPDSYVAAAKLHPKVYTIPSHIVNNHEILKMKLNVRPTVISNPLHPKHLTIPSGVFIAGKDGTPVKSTSALQELVRLLHREHDRLYPKRQPSVTNRSPGSQDSHLAEGCSSYEVDHTGRSYEHSAIDEHKCSDYLGSYLTIASCFWTWWRTQPIPKYVRDNAQCVNVPIAIIDDLILASRKAILQDTNSLLVTNGCYSIPTLLIHQMLEVVGRLALKGSLLFPMTKRIAKLEDLETWLPSGKECVAFARKSTCIMDLF